MRKGEVEKAKTRNRESEIEKSRKGKREIEKFISLPIFAFSRFPDFAFFAFPTSRFRLLDFPILRSESERRKREMAASGHHSLMKIVKSYETNIGNMHV